MRIGIDVDGVLRDFVNFLILYYKTYFPRHRVVPYEDWNWDLNYNFPDWEGTWEEFDHWIFRRHGYNIMTGAKPFPGAIKALNNLVESTRGKHDIIIVSHQLEGTEPYTLEWLGKHGAKIREVRFEKEKIKSNCEILVDDKTENLEEFFSSGKVAIPISRPWNREWKKTPKKKNIQEAVDLLKVL